MRCWLCLALACFLLFAGAACSRRDIYSIPPDLWSVELAPAPHAGDAGLRVLIDRHFNWPPPDAGQPVVYQVVLNRPGAGQLVVGELTAQERFSLVLIPPVVEELALSDEALAQRRATRIKDRENLISKLAPNGATAPAELDKILRQSAPMYDGSGEANIGRRTAVLEYSIQLKPIAGGRAVARQEQAPKKPAAKYKWGIKVADDKDACNGKTPEECALEKVKKIRDAICSAKKPDQTSRFPKECEKLTRMLKKEPPEPSVECEIPSDKGVTAGETDALTGKIRLNGENFLTDTCADAVLIHELTHSLEFDDPAKYPNFKKLKEAQERYKKAMEALKKAVTEAEKQTARHDAAKAMVEQMGLNEKAGNELLEAECNALFATIDNGDYFGYPGGGLQWMKENIKGMVGELGGVRNEFGLPDGGPAGPLCKCFTKIRDYVGAHDDIKKNLEKDQVKEGMSWMNMIDILTKLYCKP